jgi:hypothetical protein
MMDSELHTLNSDYIMLVVIQTEEIRDAGAEIVEH